MNSVVECEHKQSVERDVETFDAANGFRLESTSTMCVNNITFQIPFDIGTCCNRHKSSKYKCYKSFHRPRTEAKFECILES